MHLRHFDQTRPAKFALNLTRDPTRPDPRVDPTRVHPCARYVLHIWNYGRSVPTLKS